MIFTSYSEMNKLSGNADISICVFADLIRVFSCNVTHFEHVATLSARQSPCVQERWQRVRGPKAHDGRRGQSTYQVAGGEADQH